MSHEYSRKGYYRDRERERERDRDRDRDREWSRSDYSYEKRRSISRKQSRSPLPKESSKRRSRSPRKNDKDMLDENILSEISKLPEPSELWDNQTQDGRFPTPPAPTFSQDGSNYGNNYNQSYSGMYNEFPPGAPAAPHQPDMASWNQMSLPPPAYNVEEQIKKEAAIETEKRHQKAALAKQREDYIKKATILKKELDTLKDQRNELRGDTKRSPSPDTKRFLKENTKLQLEIQNKLKTINSVVDMLNGIIGEEAQEVVDSDDSTDRGSKRKSRSPSGKKFNYVYYDPEMHWCRVCNEFPPTAKDYLNHLHSPAHHKMAAAHMEAPWHSVSGVNEGFPSYASAPTKRTPIRGLQFFVPSTAWYCKLCDQFIGDLHCASAHLKSITHSKNYTNFVEQNPHWETDWMSDRQKAIEKARANNKNKMDDKPQYTATTITFNKDGFHTKLKMDSPPPGHEEKKKKKEKKKKSKRKRSSSSSSSSSSSGSDSEPKKKKKGKKKSKYDTNDKLSEWMSSIQMDRLNENDRKLLDNIKTRIKLDKMESARRSSEREHGAGLQQRAREQERRDSRARDERERRDESRRREERRDERVERDSGRRSSQRQDAKKPEIRKMPFIGKMPVYKNLKTNNKPSNEEQKKDDSKKKVEDEVTKKRREEMDAEIQKKVAEFKQKIASAQLERQQSELAPSLLLPTLPLQHPFLPPPQPPPPASTAPPANLPKDFQDALDIIFPSEVKNGDMSKQQEMFQALPPGLAAQGFPGIPGLGGVMQPFPTQLIQQGLLGNPPHMMMGFEMNAPLFQPRQQLYDAHVPVLPNQKNRQQNNTSDAQMQNVMSVSGDETTSPTVVMEGDAERAKAAPPSTKNREELDDLAMLGIDASDVGAGI